jgi:hypothetical protein
MADPVAISILTLINMHAILGEASCYFYRNTNRNRIPQPVFFSTQEKLTGQLEMGVQTFGRNKSKTFSPERPSITQVCTVCFRPWPALCKQRNNNLALYFQSILYFIQHLKLTVHFLIFMISRSGQSYTCITLDLGLFKTILGRLIKFLRNWQI